MICPKEKSSTSILPLGQLCSWLAQEMIESVIIVGFYLGACRGCRYPESSFDIVASVTLKASIFNLNGIEETLEIFGRRVSAASSSWSLSTAPGCQLIAGGLYRPTHRCWTIEMSNGEASCCAMMPGSFVVYHVCWFAIHISHCKTVAMHLFYKNASAYHDRFSAI